MCAADSFVATLRLALEHLYDPAALQTSPLIRLFDLQNKDNAAAKLHDTLQNAIEALEPADNVPTGERAWRVYEILFYRYIQQAGQREVASQIGLRAYPTTSRWGIMS